MIPGTKISNKYELTMGSTGFNAMQKTKFVGTNSRRLFLTGTYLRGLFSQVAIKKSCNIVHVRESGKEHISNKHSFAKIN